MASANPCPNSHIPPIRFEFSDILATSLVQEHRIQLSELYVRTGRRQANRLRSTGTTAWYDFPGTIMEETEVHSERASSFSWNHCISVSVKVRQIAIIRWN
jgi:hypothetical protein